MRKQILQAILIMAAASIFSISCQKEIEQKQNKAEIESESAKESADAAARHCSPDPYNLDIDLDGTGNRKGSIKFRQDPDPARIVTLDTKVHHLQPNHEYLLQRAVDQTIDGNCTGTNWLTLGLGLTPQSILTNGGGNGHEELWRDLSAIPSGTVFDIHFQVLDAANNAVVLTSGCYQYTVR
jgi:hypothetical protein